MFSFHHKLPAVGYLELLAHHASTQQVKPAVRLPFHSGTTFMGREEGLCEFEPRAELQGIVEASQVWMRMGAESCAVTDATSTNLTTLVRADSSAAYLANNQDLVVPNHIVEIQHESFDTPLQDRCWTPVFSGDLLCHVYGIWRVVF